MLISQPQLADLAAQLSGDHQGIRVASVDVECGALAVVRAGARLFGRSSYFRSPDGSEFAGLGTALRLSASGVDRFGNLQDQLRGLEIEGSEVRFTIGFSFGPNGPTAPEWDGFGALDVVLPEIGVMCRGSGAKLTVAIPTGGDPGATLAVLAGLSSWDAPPPPDPGVHTVESIPSTADWQSEVAEAVGAIRGGSLDKVVLARSVLVESERATDPYDLVHHLTAANPASYIYAMVTGDAAFVGASPELLLAHNGSEVRLNPLAGSARRGKGEDDVAAGEQLLASGKDRAEHAIVVEDLVARLGPITSRLEYENSPSLRRMATVQHLSTGIEGTLLRHVSSLDVLASIHPTPAVGGTPRPEALAFIDKAEGIDRGWYSGGVGWLDPAGSGLVALALRCALLRGRSSRLYAGNGIVAESDPAAELEETRLKFQPLLNLLAAT